MSEVEQGAAPVDAQEPAEVQTPALGGEPVEQQAPTEPAEQKDYSVEIEGFNFDEFKAIPENQELLNRAKDVGLSNEQVSFMLGEYNALLPKLAGEISELKAEETTSKLKEVWGDKFDSSIADAQKALLAAGFTKEDLNNPSIGNNVELAKLAAHFGAQMKEDAPPLESTASTAGFDIASLLSHPAYNNPVHPEFKQVMSQVDSYYSKPR